MSETSESPLCPSCGSRLLTTTTALGSKGEVAKKAYKCNECPHSWGDDMVLDAYGISRSEAQLMGYFYAKKECTLDNLLSTMGLTIAEWEKIKSDYPINSYMSNDDINNIDNYFKQETP